MVLLQRQQAMTMRRQSSCPGTTGNQQQQQQQQTSAGIHNPTRRGDSFVSCAMGDDDDDGGGGGGSISSFSRQSSLSSLASHGMDRRRRSSILPSTIGGGLNTNDSGNFHNGSYGSSYNSSSYNSSSNSYSSHRHVHVHVKTPRWLWMVACAMIALSWVRAVQFWTANNELLEAMNTEFEAIELQKRHSTRLLKDATDTKNSIARQQWKLKKTQKNFKHETRMIEEMAELEAAAKEEDSVEIPREARDKFRNRRTGDVAQKWIEHRQEALLHKVYSLQAYIQASSRQRVIEKYGYGPHHVVFHVKSREGRKSGKFTVRMAPLHTVPHAVETFLDMIANRVWDNTVFYYHHTANHVVGAAPVAYGTFQSKDHDLEAMGFNGVSFPEYSPAFPHKAHTLGFAGTGPHFYLNTVDNEDHHGPGSQGHHELAGDADPCFGEVLSGFDTLREMQYARHRGETARGWQDYDLTRIISATVVGLF
mmetsp:Transcript_4213/g.12079  ORF Transcript_4213/g.12079 Transcript_4213/m.12079 type:complete len:478 (+) Transcript_4213:188-1621(+)|eukprot:CAMPEP_0172359654 /NCGR_PEP_ID=MMETSP1060-20121228/3843_1 /TAXON_ID=37318 /ORGANISM="Pseudo-nitzschia pungens, Strain cf. cingulata" /LENGTH=477 /DNA_ID=CAMNT_0013081417 /DNA_START=188 /DNA_END=1621 /DNA_ORIENTATION=-